MELALKCGVDEERIRVPVGNLLAVASPPGRLPAPADGGEALIREALASPLGAPPLREMARGKDRVTIIISDHTRPTPSRFIIPFLLKELEPAGIGDGQVTVLLATGLHRPPDIEQVRAMLGGGLMDRLRVVVHDPDDAGGLADLGSTSRGTPLYINRLVTEADLVISLSTVEPHRLYGWNGGAKNIVPGVAGRLTVEVHHGRYKTDPGGIDIVEGNAFREDAEEAARLAGLDLILNAILDEERRIVGVKAGDVVAAHRAIVELGRTLNVCQVPARADILVCSLGGHPRDVDFWQAQGKGIGHVQHVLNDGGTMILLADCGMGVGAEPFARLMKEDLAEIEGRSDREGFSVPLSKAADMAAFVRRARLFLVSPGLGPADFPRLPVAFFDTAQEALDRALAEAGGGAGVLVVPDSSRTVIGVKETGPN